ncbi:MAG: hypothetical protein MUF54_20060 [Polyangiaceae bacterium]|jgi:hypothetical protein|nr:hypothetical protein [Polyangiaceae bacterium]
MTAPFGPRWELPAVQLRRVAAGNGRPPVGASGAASASAKAGLECLEGLELRCDRDARVQGTQVDGAAFDDNATATSGMRETADQTRGLGLRHAATVSVCRGEGQLFQ